MSNEAQAKETIEVSDKWWNALNASPFISCEFIFLYQYINTILYCVQSKRDEQSTCWSKARSLCRKSGRGGRLSSKAPSCSSWNSRRSTRGKKLRRKRRLLTNCRLIRMLASIMHKRPPLIRLARILLVTSKTCTACNLPKKKRRLTLAAGTWLWTSSSTKKATTSKTLQDSWSGPNENEESLLSDSLMWT